VDKLGRIDSDNRKICLGIIADELRKAIAAIREIHGYSGSLMDDMAVGQNEAIGRNHESGSASGDIARSTFSPLLDLNVYNSRRDAANCAHHRARIFVE
jgi:hypothetical protein